MKKLTEIYKYAIDRLNEANLENAAYDAKIIFETVFSVKYSDLLLHPEMSYNERLTDILDTFLLERIKGRPLQYIIGQWDFMGYTFKVGEGVLIPRPETEQLVEYAAERLKNVPGPVIYDLCAGSGCIGLSIKKILTSARVIMVEKSDAALYYLNMNREEFSLALETSVVKGDILKGYEAFSALPRPDVILSNPPYVKKDEIKSLQKEVQYEPEMALDGGEDGLDFYRCLAEKWLPYINENGFIAAECGEDQGDKISAMFEPHCSRVSILNDFSNVNRIVIGDKA